LQPNIHSDQAYAKEVLVTMEEQEGDINLIVDGGYYSFDNKQLAETIHTELIPTALVGRSIGVNNSLLP